VPTLHIIKETEILDSFRVQQIRGMFDYQSKKITHEWTSNLPIEQRQWAIGLIVGPSGSGKTTIAKQILTEGYFHESFEWHNQKAIVDCFPDHLSIKEITGMFNSVGFSSPPHWLKPFCHLSNGQKFRVELARCLLINKKGIIFDEFTSVIDRDVAKVGCAAISKALRRKDGPPFIAVSCHYDIIDWLNPDWVFDVGTQCFEWRERRRFPEICIDIFKADTTAWNMFRQHHYLDHTIHKAAQCYVAKWKNKNIGFCSVLHFPHPSSAIIKREHRTVVLPDFQGIGIGNRLSEFVASFYRKKGFRFMTTTSSPAMINHRSKSKLWKCGRFGVVAQNGKTSTTHQQKSSRRVTASFEYIGP
jgi:ABC-type dipeptide/oligopeptide/nickel transport system ATPase subunit/GNAT superfamily N-acetyltransferase